MFQHQSMKIFPVPIKIKKLNNIFSSHNEKIYIVGGAIRDYLLKIPNHDFDFCTSAVPEKILSMFKKVIPTGIKHGTVTVIFENDMFEITTFRTEKNYKDFRHPETITYVSNLEEDLSRRDFTVNALACDCETGIIIDLFNGFKDLKHKKIRCIGNPKNRFTEDALRLLRMCRFCSKLNFSPESNTLKEAKNLSSNIIHISSERIHDELDKILLTSHPDIGINLMKKTRLLFSILPELKYSSNSYLYKNILKSIKNASRYNYSLIIRWTCLLIYLGKNPDECAYLVNNILKRLKFSNFMKDKILNLIQNQLQVYNFNWTNSEVKRFINKVGIENVELLFELQHCINFNRNATKKITKVRESFKNRYQIIKNEPSCFKDLAINGDDLIKNGIKSGPEIKNILNTMLDDVIDYPEHNTKEYLMTKVLNVNE